MAKRSNMAQKTPVTFSKSSPEQPSSNMGGASAPTKLPERETKPGQGKSASSGMSSITHEMIAHRAYEIWKTRGGSDMENWLRAEQELHGGTTASA